MKKPSLTQQKIELARLALEDALKNFDLEDEASPPNTEELERLKVKKEIIENIKKQLETLS